MTKATTTRTAAQAKVADAYETVAEKLKGAQAGVRELSEAAVASSRATLEGVVEFDRVVKENLRSGLTDGVAHSRAVLKAQDLQAVLGLQQEFATKTLNNATEQTRALLGLVQANVKKSWAPLLELAQPATLKPAAARAKA